MKAFSSRCINNDFVWNVEDSDNCAVDLMDAPSPSSEASLMRIVKRFVVISRENRVGMRVPLIFPRQI